MCFHVSEQLVLEKSDPPSRSWEDDILHKNMQLIVQHVEIILCSKCFLMIMVVLSCKCVMNYIYSVSAIVFM